jgi:hypothetical protein
VVVVVVVQRRAPFAPDVDGGFLVGAKVEVPMGDAVGTFVLTLLLVGTME